MRMNLSSDRTSSTHQREQWFSTVFQNFETPLELETSKCKQWIGITPRWVTTTIIESEAQLLWQMP